MNWNDIWKVALAVCVSFGGIAGIATLLVKFCGGLIAERLSKKYDLKLSKELENLKSNLEKKNYISKTRFDVEFSIYRELSRVFFEMARSVNTMIPSGLSQQPPDDETALKEYKNKIYSAARNYVILSQDSLEQNAPFITAEFYKQFDEILELCKHQLSVFERYICDLHSPQEGGVPN
jgi:hypothetical protein